MSDTDVEVRFGGDPTGAVEASAAAKDAIAGVGAPVAGLQGQLTELTSAIAEMSAAMREMAATSATVGSELAEEEAEIKGIAGSIREFGAAASETKEAVLGFGEAFMAFFAVEQIGEWINKTAEAGEHAEQLGQKLGMSASEIQAWQGVATLTGRSVDQFTTAFTRLTDNLVKGAGGSKQQAEAMKDLGLTAQDALNPTEALAKAADRFKEMRESGETARAIADAMALMGRSGADMLPILEKGSAGLEELKQKAAETGAVLTGGQNVAVVEAAEKINEFKLRMQGLSEQAFVQLIPLIEDFVEKMGSLITAITQALQPTSSFRQMLDDLRPVIVGVAAVLAGNFVLGLVEATGAVTAFKEAMAVQAALAAMEGETSAFAIVLGTFTVGVEAATAAVIEFTVALLANPLTWVAIALGTAAAAFEYLTTKTHAEKVAEDELRSTNEQIISDFTDLTSKTRAQIDAEIAHEQQLKTTATMQLWAAESALAHAQAEDVAARKVFAFAETVATIIPIMQGAVTGAEEMWNAFANKGAKAAQNTVDNLKSQIASLDEAMKKLAASPGAKPGDLGALGLPKPKKDKGGDAGNESDMQALQEAFDQQEASHKDMIQNMKADELAYWSAVKTNIQGGALTERDAAAVRMKVAVLTHDMAIEAIQDEIAKRREADATAISDIQTAQQRKKQALEQEIKDTEDAAKNGLISRQAAQAKVLALIDEEKRAAIDAAKAIEGIKVATDTFIETKAAQGTAEFKQAEKDKTAAAVTADRAITAAADAAATHIDAVNRKAADDYEKMWTQRIQGVVSKFSQGLQGMINGTTTFRQFVISIFQSIESAIFTAIEKMVTKWIVHEITKTIVSQDQSLLRQGIAAIESIFGIGQKKIETTADISASVAKAGAGGVASMAAAPFPIDLTAPAFGAEMASAAAAFGAAGISAAGGYDIPPGINPIVQTHAEEMILPANIANPLRSMLAMGNGAGNTGGSNGDTHLHYHAPDVNQSGAPLGAQLERHAGDVIRWMERAARDGKLKTVMKHALGTS